MPKVTNLSFRPALLALVLAAMSGCSDRPISDVPQQQVSLELEPASMIVDPGQNVAVAAYVIGPDGKRVLAKSPAYTVEWSVSDPTIATIAANGAVATVTGVRGGAAQVEAVVYETQSAQTLRRSANVTTRPSVVALRIASGNHQAAAVATTLPQQLTVQVINRDGFGVSGAAVNFTLRSGTGVLGEQQVISDANGFARSTFTFGSEPGLVTIEASAEGVPAVSFDEIAIAPPAALEEYQGNLQQAPEGAPLPAPLGVRVLDSTLKPLAGVTVSWTVVSGGGQITSTSVSDNAGVATAFWTLGAAGTQTAKASHGNINANFHATAVSSQPDKLLKVSGDGQSGTVGTVLKDSLVVRVVDGQGNPKAGVPVAFSVTSGGGSVSPTQIATNALGFAKAAWTLGSAAGLGAVRVAATNVGSLSFSSTAQVVGSTTSPTPVVSSLVMTPQTLSLTAVGAQSTLSAATYDANGQVVSGQTINFTSSNPMVVIVDNVGRLTAKGVGTALIIASALCCDKADTTAVTVSQQIASLAVSPKTASLTVGGSQQLAVSAVDANGNPISGAQVSWSSSNAAVATISSGVVQAVSAGTAYIRAVSGAYKDSAAVTVTGSSPSPAPVLTTITLTPTNPSLVVGATQTFAAVAKDQNGSVMTGVSFTWTTSNASVMTVSQGVVTALVAGVATLRVASGTVSASTQVTVSAPAPPPLPGQFSPPDLAFADMENGTTAPFGTTTGTTTGNADITIMDDPTGKFGGKVARIEFSRQCLSCSADVNRALRFEYPRGIGLGQTVFIRGHVLIPTPQSNMTGAQRKLYYVQRDPNDLSFLFLKAESTTPGGQPLKMVITDNRVFSAGSIMFDQKTSIEVQITTNSAVGVADGIVRVWVNGNLTMDKSGLELLDSTKPFESFRFGQQTQHLYGDKTVTFDEYRYWDNMAVSTKRIGP